jgi:hypothetical protein
MCEHNCTCGNNETYQKAVCYLRDGVSALVAGSQDGLAEPFCGGCRRTKDEILKAATIKVLSWMTAHMQWREDELRGNDENVSGGYSPELNEGLNLLERWKEQAG